MHKNDFINDIDLTTYIFMVTFHQVTYFGWFKSLKCKAKALLFTFFLQIFKYGSSRILQMAFVIKQFK